MDFGRLITAMVTPFDGDGEINWEATSRLVDYLIEEQKSEALVVCGTTGESPTLSEEEKLRLFPTFWRKRTDAVKSLPERAATARRIPYILRGKRRKSE